MSMNMDEKSDLIKHYIGLQVKDDALWHQQTSTQKALQILHLMLTEWDIEQIKKEITRYEKDSAAL